MCTHEQNLSFIEFSSINLEYPFSKAYNLGNNRLKRESFLNELEEMGHESRLKMREMQFSSAIHESPRPNALLLPQLLLRNSAHDSRQLKIQTTFFALRTTGLLLFRRVLLASVHPPKRSTRHNCNRTTTNKNRILHKLIAYRG